MKLLYSTLLTAALLFSTTAGHSWCECTDDKSNYEELHADPQNANLKPACNGYPRNKVNQGDWITESSDYLWDLGQHGGRDAPCCHPDQRDPSAYPKEYPPAQAKTGQTLRIRYWGNGHSSYTWGAPIHKDPGLVRMYWAGDGKQLVNAIDLTPDKMLSEGNFSADAVTISPHNDKGNWMFLNIPKSMPPGRQMFVWAWAPVYNSFEGTWENKYTTCLDIDIVGSEDTTGYQPGWTPDTQSQGAADPAEVQAKCAATCNRGGQKTATCTGSSCPPCRYGPDCYEYKDGKCPFPSGFDCAKQQVV